MILNKNQTIIRIMINYSFIIFILIAFLFIHSQDLNSITLEKADSIAQNIGAMNDNNSDSSKFNSENEALKKKDNPYSFLLNSSKRSSNSNDNDNFINKTNQENEWGFLVLKLIIVLISLIILIYLFVLFLKKVQTKKVFNSNLPTELYSILGNAPITFNKNFIILKFYDKIYLLAVSDNSISVIDKIDDMEEINNIEQIIPKSSTLDLSKSAFSKLLKKNMNKLSK